MANNGYWPKHVKTKCFLTHIKLVTRDGLLPASIYKPLSYRQSPNHKLPVQTEREMLSLFSDMVFSTECAVEFVTSALTDIEVCMGQLIKAPSLPSDNEAANHCPHNPCRTSRPESRSKNTACAPKVTTDMQGSPACIVTVLQSIS